MKHADMVEAERFLVYRPQPAFPIKPIQTVSTASVERIVEAAINKAVKQLKKQHEKEIEETQRMFFNAGRYANGARDDTAIKAHTEMLLILGE